jgi:uncharacterized lipoprotein YmbA
MNRSLLTVLTVVILSSCSFFSKTKSTIYTIDPLPGQAATTRSAIAIGSIELPAGFDRKEVVVRKANSELDVRGTQLWSSTLSDVVLHTLAFDLANRLPAGMMILPGETKPASSHAIDVVFENLAAGPESKVVVDAIWDRTHREHIEVPVSSLDSANVATGMSQALGQLADRIAAALPR